MTAAEPSTTEPASRRPQAGGSWRFAVATLVAYAVVGAVAGVVWELVWTPPTQQVVDHQIFYTSYESLRRVFSGTGLYTLIAAVAAAVVTAVVTSRAKGRELLCLAEVVIGSVIASLVMWRVGVALGPDTPQRSAASVANGTKVSGTLAVSGHTAYLVWPMVSLLVLALVFFAFGHTGSSSSRAHVARPDDPAEAGLPDSPAR